MGVTIGSLSLKFSSSPNCKKNLKIIKCAIKTLNISELVSFHVYNWLKSILLMLGNPRGLDEEAECKAVMCNITIISIIKGIKKWKVKNRVTVSWLIYKFPQIR